MTMIHLLRYHARLGKRKSAEATAAIEATIEFGEIESSVTTAMLERFIAPLLAQDADTLVLGCTHYPLVQASIERVIAGQCVKWPLTGLAPEGSAPAAARS